MRGASDGNMVTFVVESRPELKRRERLLRVTRIIAERTAIFIVTDRTCQCVVGDHIDFVEPTHSIAEVQAIVTRAANRLFVTHAAQNRNTSCLECRIQWTEKSAWKSISAERRDVVRSNRNGRIEVDGFVFVQAEYVYVLSFER